VRLGSSQKRMTKVQATHGGSGTDWKHD
jgi:hypothetical protein